MFIMNSAKGNVRNRSKIEPVPNQSFPDQRKKASKKIKKKARKLARAAARESAVGFAGNFVGEEAARTAYKAANLLIKTKVAQRKATNPDSINAHKRLHLSAVASKYLLSHLNPFDPIVRGAHIPTTPSYPTYKAMGFVRGTAFIGTQGVGFVSLSPTVANDSIAVCYTTSAYAQAMAAQPPSDTGVLSGSANCPAIALMSNLPYKTTDITSTTFGSKVEARIVSSCLRVQYTGTELNRSGMVYAYSDPDGDNCIGNAHLSSAAGSGYTIDTLSQKEATEIFPVTKKFVQVLALPPNSICLDFTNQNATATRQVYPFSSGDNITFNSNSFGAHSVLIMITGVPGQSIYFEAVTHVEYEGSGVTQSLLTESQADVVGLDAVQNILARAQRRCATDAQATFYDSLRTTMKKLGVVTGVGTRSVDY